MNCCVFPREIDGLAGVMLIEVRVGEEPVPVRPTAMGLPGALKGIVSVPVRVPDAAGRNVTPTAQVEPAVTVVQVLLLTAKSPVAAGAETVSDVFK